MPRKEQYMVEKRKRKLEWMEEWIEAVNDDLPDPESLAKSGLICLTSRPNWFKAF